MKIYTPFLCFAQPRGEDRRIAKLSAALKSPMYCRARAPCRVRNPFQPNRRMQVLPRGGRLGSDGGPPGAAGRRAGGGRSSPLFSTLSTTPLAPHQAVLTRPRSPRATIARRPPPPPPCSVSTPRLGARASPWPAGTAPARRPGRSSAAKRTKLALPGKGRGVAAGCVGVSSFGRACVMWPSQLALADSTSS